MATGTFEKRKLTHYGKSRIASIAEFAGITRRKNLDAHIRGTRPRPIASSLSRGRGYPSPANWRALHPTSIKNRRQPALLLGVGMLLLFGLFGWWAATRNEPAPASVQAMAQINTPVTSDLPATSSNNPALPTNLRRAPLSSVQPDVHIRTLREGERPVEYLLVASANGEPIRVPLRWEQLACCLSGESTTRDCDQQRDQWHAEVLNTDLGFQADPLIGLMALLDSKQKP